MAIPVRTVNWNLLHTLESSRVKKFHYCQPGVLTSSLRLRKVTDFVSAQKPDIACFQELDRPMLEHLQSEFPQSLKMGSLFMNESIPSRDGCGVFYNSDRFDLVSSKAVRFNNIVEKHLGSLIHAARSDPSPFSLTRALSRELTEKLNLVVMAKLRDRASGKQLLACSSHLFWDPAYPDIKLLQAYLLGLEVSEYAAGSEAVIIGADLNSVPSCSGVYELLMGSGRVDIDHPDHPVSLRSNKTNKRLVGVSADDVPALQLFKPFTSCMKALTGSEPQFTNYTANFKGCLDYVMVSGNIKPVSALPVPEESELKSETALPNSKWPSDHLPLVVDLEFS